MISKKIRQALLILVGSMALGLGLLGLILPILPTTPFLLLAAFSYLHSSKRLYAWLLSHHLFGRYIQDYLIHRAIRPRIKATALILLWTSLTVSMFLVQSTVVRVALPLIGLAVSWHVLSVRSQPAQAQTNEQIDPMTETTEPIGTSIDRQQKEALE